MDGVGLLPAGLFELSTLIAAFRTGPVAAASRHDWAHGKWKLIYSVITIACASRLAWMMRRMRISASLTL
jgi:hypothetical protein